MKSEAALTAGIFHNICIVLIPQMDEGRSELLIVGSLHLEELKTIIFTYTCIFFICLFSERIIWCECDKAAVLNWCNLTSNNWPVHDHR